MKWSEAKQIFDPSHYKLPANCAEYAQSPQTLVFDDFVRIFFSTRERDNNDKFLSHVCFVDFNKQFTEVINVSRKTVISLGALGCYDEHGIFPLNVLLDEDRVLGFIGGWSRRVAVSVETSIGLAVSYDMGVSFKRVGPGPILTSAPNEPFLVGDPFVIKDEDLYHLFYIHGLRWVQGTTSHEKERVYKIAHATSKDLKIWRRENQLPIKEVLGEDECQALPSVIKIDDTYHMVFCYRFATDFRKNKNRGYRLGYAYSNNMIEWVRDDKALAITLPNQGWDSEMMCYPHLFWCDDEVYLLYNGNEFGKHGFGITRLESIK